MKSAPLTSPATDPANPAPGELAPRKKFLDQCRDVARYRQLALGHADESTTMIYTHVLNRPGLAVRSPLDLVKA